MSELNLISPLLDDFDTGGSISEHHGVSCFPAMRKESTDRYIIKRVSIPASQTQLDALLLTGAYPDAASALTYFEAQADNIVEELETLQRLSELEGFVSYEKWQVAPKESAIGYDVYMIGTYKYSLRKFLQHQPATQLSAINLGLDICAALSVCRRLGYLYVDLKPNNIYVSDNNYQIGDLGFLRLDNLKYTALPEKYCNQYTAPEALDAFSALTPTLDIYAAGLILYQIYNGGDLPFSDHPSDTEKLPAPAYADYEMAEIILKACDPNPDERWQDPVEMAQALVSYMQRNGANDTPIVPPSISLDEIDFTDYAPQEANLEKGTEKEASDLAATDVLPETSEETSAHDDLDLPGIVFDTAPDGSEEDVIPADADPQYNEDDFGNLSFLDALLADETSPENNLTDVDYDEISDELSEILNQADALVAHPVPESVITIEQSTIDSLEAEVVAVQEETPHDDFLEVVDEDEAKISVDGNAAITIDPVAADETIVVQPVQEDIPSDDSEEMVDVDNDDSSDAEIGSLDADEPAKQKKKQITNWILTAIIFVLIAAIAAVGFFYYRTIYLLPINDITVDGNESNMIVFVDTEIDETLLSVVCSDSHGNQISAPVVNGTAIFANLTPDTAYNVRIIVDGFHRLTGETAASYSTPAQTNVAQFSAVTGAEDGSVILSFTLEGPDSGNWQIQYSAPNEETVTVDVLSHMVTLTDLVVGKEYTFTLIPGSDMYITGTTEITHTVSNLVYAEDVLITGCTNNQLTVAWSSPKDFDVDTWTVRCYNDADYNQTAITSETSAVFSDIDTTTNYTVEVLAAGMSVSERAYMPANAITITNFTADTSDPDMISLSWESSQPIPTDGWILLYSVDDSSAQGTVTCTENSVQLTPVIPNASYTFKLQQADGTPVLSQQLRCQSPEAQDFSGYGMTRSTMSFQLCKHPDDENWRWKDIADADYTTTFKLGDKIGLVGKLDGLYGLSDDDITALFVIRDLEGNLVSYASETRTWNDMWNQSYAEISIPQIPGEIGDYAVTMYFNGKFVTQKAFTITQ